MLKPTPDDLATRPIMIRNPDSRPNDVPRSIPVYEPARLIPDSEAMTQWSAYGQFNPRPYFGGWDELSQDDPRASLMAVPQADFYDASPNPWPNNGQFDRPNSIGLMGILLRLRPHTSAHPGFAMPTGGGPTMLFHAPPVFSLQTKPVPAVGV